MAPMKTPISVTIETELVKWIDEQVKTMKYRNRSHLVEVALTEFRRGKRD